jgi:uncharacterized protein (UPF0210 family)
MRGRDSGDMLAGANGRAVAKVLSDELARAFAGVDASTSPSGHKALVD